VCGIYGAVACGDAPLQHVELLEEMGRLLHHRGPDAHGLRVAPRAALGAERLRVYDPTPAGDQPLFDPTEKIWVVVNGAIYNAPEIRERYPEYRYVSHSDAEAVLPLFVDKGAACISDLDGMFAIAIYDANKHELVLARDRAGEKPLFYCFVGDELWFASEVQALLQLPPLDRSLDSRAVRDFVTLGYVTEPKTIFASIRKVKAGTYVTASSVGRSEYRYWETNVMDWPAKPILDAEEHLASLLSKAVEKQITADAPVGIFTSGGVDSSLITALACLLTAPDSVNTFSVGFTEPPFDESPYARQLASYLGTNHRSVEADRESLTGALDIIVERLAEPCADPAILPTYLLALAARDHVKVVLGGEGADELFGGYPTYIGHRAAPYFQKLSASVQTMFKRMAEKTPTSLEGKVSLEYLTKRFLAGADLPLFDRHVSWFGTGAGVEVLNPDLANESYDPPEFHCAGDPISDACIFDYRTYLRDNLLMKVDRATMLASIEARAPYLDLGVTAFAFALDSRLKVRGFTTKWLLKQVALRWLPRNLVFRKKRGLSVPVATWLNGGLRADADRLLDFNRIKRQGLLHPGNVSQLLFEHQNRRANHGRLLWALLMLEYWLERWVPER
jgi:asparagine synthase (glutamine-hydrolysing)